MTNHFLSFLVSPAVVPTFEIKVIHTISEFLIKKIYELLKNNFI